MYVNERLSEPPMRVVSDIESLVERKPVQKALWIGVKVVEFAPVTRLRGVPKGRPTLTWVLYHTHRNHWHPSGRGLHHYFPELLEFPEAESSFGSNPLRTSVGVQALLEAETRVDYLTKAFPNKTIQFSSSSYFVPGFLYEDPLPPNDLAVAHGIAIRDGLPLPRTVSPFA